jgi:hypothetical protein
MLGILFLVLLILWGLGWVGHIGGELIHLLLLAAFVVLLYHLVRGSTQR